MIITNPNRRCCLCDGREVLGVEGETVIETSLVLMNGKFFCKDRKECNQNIKAENTEFKFLTDGKKIKGLSKKVFGKEVFAIEEGDEND
jgi:hypothetical protein